MGISSIKIPDVGEGVAEVELVEWYVNVGDTVKEDDVLAAVMTDKATMEIPCLFDGKILSLGGALGDTLVVGAELLTIEHDGKLSGAVEAKVDVATTGKPEEAVTPPEKPVSESTSKLSSQPAPAAKTPVADRVRAPRPEGQPPLAAPSVRARAREAGIDLRQVAGSGRAGRIMNSDLDTVFDAGSAPKATTSRRREGSQNIRIMGLRRKIADRMSLANTRIPHITVIEEIDVTALDDLRATMNASRGDKPKLAMLPFVSAALCRAVDEHPEMNAHFDDDAGVVTRHAPVHIGIATMTNGGLVVPVLRHAESYAPFAAAREIARLAEAARTGKATRDELAGSTITITSLGPLGALATTPIINHPEVAILGINKMATRPMWDGSQFVPRKMMNISASFDHRVIDGWDAATFVALIKRLLEIPAMIFMENET